MARSKAVKPQRRGMVTAVAFSCCVVFAGIMALRGDPSLRRAMAGHVTGGASAAYPDTTRPDDGGSLFSKIFSSGTDGNDLAGVHADGEATLSAVDERTLALADRGAVVGPVRLMSGDKIEIGGHIFVLWGIRVPPANYSCTVGTHQWFCGDEAMKAMKALIGDQLVGCFTKATDLNGNSIARCYVGFYDLGSRLIQDGWAVQDKSVTNDYSMVQEMARTNHNGLWSTDFTPSALSNF